MQTLLNHYFSLSTYTSIKSYDDVSFNRIVHTRIIAYTNNIQENMVIFENDSSEENLQQRN